MSPTIKNVIIVGASGSLGAPIFAALHSSGKFNLTILGRPSSTATYPKDIKVIHSDYSPSSLATAFAGQDAVISALGAAGIDQEFKLIDAAVQSGVKRFIPSEFSCNSTNEKTTALIPVFGLKVKINEYLKDQEEKGLSWTGVIAGLALDWNFDPSLSGTTINGLLGFDVEKKEALIFDGGNKTFSTTLLSHIGNAVVAVLSKPEETANQFIFVHSFTTTQNEILAVAEKATGAKWKVTEQTTAAALAEGEPLFKKGDYSGLFSLLRVITFGDGYGSAFEKEAVEGNKRLGLESQDVEETVKALV